MVIIQLFLFVWKTNWYYEMAQWSNLSFTPNKRTEEDQVRYFEAVVKDCSKNNNPTNFFFPILEGDKVYGGLVHINWLTKCRDSVYNEYWIEKEYFQLGSLI
jgi:hypothetical protein